MLEKSGKNARDRQTAVLHRDPVPVELVSTDTAGPLGLPETHVSPATTGTVHGRAAGAQPGAQQLPASRLGQLHSRARLVRGAADHHFILPLVTAGEEKEQNSPSTAGPRASPAFQGSPLPSSRRQTSSPWVRVDTGVQGEQVTCSRSQLP